MMVDGRCQNVDCVKKKLCRIGSLKVSVQVQGR